MTTDLVKTEDVQLNYEETLQYSQRMRRKVVSHLTQEGQHIPGDIKEVNTVLKALADMDKTAIDERKNNIEQGNADSARLVAEATREFILQQKNRNPFEADEQTVMEGQPPQVSPEMLGEHALVPGEAELGVIQERSEDFMKRMGEQLKAKEET